MKIVIVGGGNVGQATAKAALSGNDLHVIEKDSTVAENIRNVLPVSILNGDASNPNTLRNAIERISPDMLISAVREDGINIFVCSNAKRFNKDVRTIACIRNPEFLDKEGYEGVDVFIAPDDLSSDKMIKVALLENAVNYEKLYFKDYSLTTFKIERGHQIVGKTVMNIALPEGCTIICIYRGDKAITEISTTEVHPDDRIVILGTWKATQEFNELIGIKKEAKEFVILGAGHQGLSIARAITESGKKNFVKILDNDINKCREASKQLKKAIVVNGNIVDPQFLLSESIDRADALISVTDVDERNLLACMTAMRFGIRKIISRYSIEEYEGIFKYAGIESVVGYHKIIANEITRSLRNKANCAVHVMENRGDFFLGFKLDRGSPMAGEYYGDLVIPEGVNVCAMIRKGVMTFPDMLTKFEIGDWVLLYTHEVEPLQLTGLLGNNAPEF